MIKKGAEIFDYKEELKKSHGYSDEFAECLVLLADDMIAYLGEEYAEVVYDTIRNTDYMVATQKKKSKVYENTSDVLERIGVLKDLTVEQASELSDGNKRSANISIPTIAFDGKEYRLTNIRRVIVLPHHFNPDSIASIKELFKNTLEAVKNSLNTYSIDGTVLTVKNGLQVETRNLSYRNGEVASTLSNIKGEGLEKGTTLYDELCFMRTYHDASYDVQENSDLRILAGYLYDNLDLRDSIRVAAITKDYDNLKEIIEKTSGLDYDTFMAQLDSLYAYEKEISKSILDSEELTRANQKRDDYYKGAIVPMINEMNNTLTKEEMLKDGYKKS